MTTHAPPWLGRTGDLTDTERWAAMTPDERLAVFVEVCELADAILQGRADAVETLARVEALSPEAEATWRRLVREAGRARSTG